MRKNGVYSDFTFQVTATAATHKTNAPTALWKFKLGPVVVMDGIPESC